MLNSSVKSYLVSTTGIEERKIKEVKIINNEFTKEINKPKPSIKTIPFISVYNLPERRERSFSKIKLFAQHISLLTFLVFVIAEEVNIKLNMIEPN